FTPVPGTTVNADSIRTAAGNLLTLSGAGAEALQFFDVEQVDDTTFRFIYTGADLTAGTVNVAFNAGTWQDSDGNLGDGGTGSVELITQSKSFFIELSGGILLQAAGFTEEPLVDLRADVTLEIDPVRKVFTLTFDGELSIIKLGTVGATSGRFVLDMGD